MTALITTTEAAARLGVDTGRVRRLAARWAIGQKVGPRAWVFTADDLATLASHIHGKPGRPARSRQVSL